MRRSTGANSVYECAKCVRKKKNHHSQSSPLTAAHFNYHRMNMVFRLDCVFDAHCWLPSNILNFSVFTFVAFYTKDMFVCFAKSTCGDVNFLNRLETRFNLASVCFELQLIGHLLKREKLRSTHVWFIWPIKWSISAVYYKFFAWQMIINDNITISDNSWAKQTKNKNQLAITLYSFLLAIRVNIN